MIHYLHIVTRIYKYVSRRKGKVFLQNTINNDSKNLFSSIVMYRMRRL